MTTFSPFYLDYNLFLTNQKCFIIVGERLGYLTAFLNSSIFRVCFNSNFPVLGNGLELSKVFFEKIPILKINQSLDSNLTKTVKELQELSIDSQKRQRLIYEIESQLYGVYNLNQNEKKILEALDNKNKHVGQ